VPSSPTIIEVRSGLGWAQMLRQGADDIIGGLKRWQTWNFLSWHEIRRQYQRSVLGPFWLTINMGILVGALGWFYAGVFGQELDTFLPYVALGFMVFGLIAGLVNDSCAVFSGAAASIRQSQLPLSFYVYKQLCRHMIAFAHNFAIYVVVWLVFPIPLGWSVLLAIPGLLLILISGFFAALLIGPLSARFRDIPPIIASVMQIFFFLTPVFWSAESLSDRAYFVQVNPFYHYLELVRRPLLGGVPSELSWIVAGSLTVLIAAGAFVFFGRVRSQIAYWA
jgi:ABC-2 type transport system permease protein/lipopolysaccharide transport system permease protein